MGRKHCVIYDHTVVYSSFQVVRRHLTNALRKKRPHCEIENLIFHQDNAPAHRSEDTLMTIDFLGYERLQHPPYSPDLAPMDFAVFPRLKTELRGCRFESEEELKFAVRSAVRSFEKDWYQRIYHKWVKRHEKCIECKGEYFEKQWTSTSYSGKILTSECSVLYDVIFFEVSHLRWYSIDIHMFYMFNTETERHFIVVRISIIRRWIC